MFSNDIYTTTPYFYIIRNKFTGIMYAGSRYALRCNPTELLKNNGYTTSSKLINYLINLNGIDSFEILRIDTYCDGMHVHDYETLFLQCLNCAKSHYWYNQHNNDNNAAYGTNKFELSMKIKYGVKNANHNDIFKNKIKSTNMQKYGVDNVFKSADIKSKIKTKNIEKYGVDNVFKNADVQLAYNNTMLEKYGVKWPMSSELIKEKRVSKYIEKYGVTNPMKSDEVKEKVKQSLLEKYGVDNMSKLPFISIIESKKTLTKSVTSRLYPELKQFY